MTHTRLAFYAICLLLLAACDDNSHSATNPENHPYIPEAPDYTDAAMWYTRENHATEEGADVFYLVSTWETDWTTDDGRVCHYADVHNATHRANMDKEISRVAFSDVRAAFDTFLERRPDPDRPFVLAGFSQGGKAVVELLKTMPAEVARRLVAAYVLGYKVTPADTLATENIRPARGATDTGVTICYNSVSDVRYIQPVVAAPCAMCINPVNWRTDATPATLHDTITVSVSPQHHVLVVKGYSGSEYQPILGFLNVGDFHSAEPWLYEECLRENIRARVEEYYINNEE